MENKDHHKEVLHIDALLPPEMAERAESVGVSKANFPVFKTLMLAILAGAFIAFGSIFFTDVTTGSTIGFGLTRFIGGLAFSLGLVLVIVGGAELFTGNNLVVMAWASSRVSTWQLMKNWAIVYIGNLAGAMFIVFLIFLSDHAMMGKGAVGINMLNIANAKCELGFMQAVALGILCNILVCLAVWLCFSALSTSGKILSILLPVAAFVTAGFEHCVANMYLIPSAILIKEHPSENFQTVLTNSTSNYDSINWSNFIISNLIPVTIGNIIGGALLVGMVYWFIFLRKSGEKDKQ